MPDGDGAIVAAEDHSFLSSLSVDRKQAISRQQKRQELLEGMDSGSQILKLHGDLQALADDLDGRVEGRLNANENAFFLAYKSFMYTVQKEFKELKQKADEEETKTRRDAKLQSLEKELDWFMNEALRLDELCKKYKKDLDRWKGKAEALEDDRQFLENQIKTAKRNNKSLRGAVEKAQTSAYAALVSSDEVRAQAQQAPTTVDAEPALAIQDAERPAATAGLSQELEERYQNCVKKLKQQLETEQRTVAKLRSAADRAFSEPSDLENFFLDCVDQVRDDVTARKQNVANSVQANTSKARPRADGPPRPSAKAVPRASVDDFTVSDRKKVVELLLSSEQVLQFIYDKLFPPAMGSISQLTADGDLA